PAGAMVAQDPSLAEVATGLEPWRGLDQLASRRRLRPLAGLTSPGLGPGLASAGLADFSGSIASHADRFLASLAGSAIGMSPSDGYPPLDLPLVFETELQLDWVAGEADPWQQPGALARARATVETLARRGVRVKLVRGRPVPAAQYQSNAARSAAAFSVPGPGGPVSLEPFALLDQATLVAQRPGRLQVVVPPARSLPPRRAAGAPTRAFATRIASAVAPRLPSPVGPAGVRAMGRFAPDQPGDAVRPPLRLPAGPALPPLPPPALMRAVEPEAVPAVAGPPIDHPTGHAADRRTGLSTDHSGEPPRRPAGSAGVAPARPRPPLRAFRALAPVFPASTSRGGVTHSPRSARATADTPSIPGGPTSVWVALNWVAGADPWQWPDVIERARESVRRLEARGIQVEIVRGHAIAAHRYLPDPAWPADSEPSVSAPGSIGLAGPVFLDSVDRLDRVVVAGERPGSIQVVISPEAAVGARSGPTAALGALDRVSYGQLLALPLVPLDERDEVAALRQRPSVPGIGVPAWPLTHPGTALAKPTPVTERSTLRSVGRETSRRIEPIGRPGITPAARGSARPMPALPRPISFGEAVAVRVGGDVKVGVPSPPTLLPSDPLLQGEPSPSARERGLRTSISLETPLPRLGEGVGGEGTPAPRDNVVISKSPGSLARPRQGEQGRTGPLASFSTLPTAAGPFLRGPGVGFPVRRESAARMAGDEGSWPASAIGVAPPLGRAPAWHTESLIFALPVERGEGSPQSASESPG
ncbi:MAG: hypothetical protein ACRDIY_22315, partial [Chloroflexota bacterium]